MPSAVAASVASIGEMLPLLLSPSVSRTTMRDSGSSSRSRFAAVARATPIAVPSRSWPASSPSTAVSTTARSSVPGTIVSASPAKATRPIQSESRPSTKRITSRFAT